MIPLVLCFYPWLVNSIALFCKDFGRNHPSEEFLMIQLISTKHVNIKIILERGDLVMQCQTANQEMNQGYEPGLSLWAAARLIISL